MTDKKSKGVSPPVATAPRQQQTEAFRRRSEIERANGERETEDIVAERQWSGVLPRPDDFARYNEVVPDAAERLLAMLEQEQAHRIALEAKIIPANMAAGRIGQLLGTGLSALALILAAGTAVYGAPWQVSVALVGVPVLSVAQTLVRVLRKSDD